MILKVYKTLSLDKMASTDKLKSGLIEKILTIDNREFLEALDQVVTSGPSSSAIVALTNEQKAMLEMSESDIKNGQLISQEAMDRKNLEWLNAM